jgi:hypothetical protein
MRCEGSKLGEAVVQQSLLLLTGLSDRRIGVVR